MSEEHISKDFVFTRGSGGELQFVGDFEGLYLQESDPWGQTGSDERLKAYYAFSRKNLLTALQGVTGEPQQPRQILEIGCGLGCVAQYLRERLPPAVGVSGMDISPTAVRKASERYPALDFFQGDIASGGFSRPERYDTVVMHQVLWYVLESLPTVFENLDLLLQPAGHLIFANAFLQDQQYGKEVIDGFDGMLRHVLLHHSSQFRVIHAHMDYSGSFHFDDGILILQKR